MYVIKHPYKAFFIENSCIVLEKPVILHRDFFIVLDLRLTKIGSKALLPFAFLGVTPPNYSISNLEPSGSGFFFYTKNCFFIIFGNKMNLNMKNKSIQTEIDACYLYRKLSENEPDKAVADVFRRMSEIEQSHAEAFARKINLPVENLIKPSWRAKTLNLIGKIISYDYVLGAMMDTEKSLSNAIIKTKEKNKQAITGAETNHVKILW